MSTSHKSSHHEKRQIPKSGFAGLKENWNSDLLSGFLVSLIALPLCLGIAGASGFPPVMGVLTAIIGGMVVSLFAGSALTIKGPAAGLIVIVSGAVEELGKGDPVLGWQLALGVVVVAGIIQVVFGLLKVAVMADFFPLSAVHGMLAAIGIIIMSKQLHFALGADPAALKGKEPVELLEMIPHSLAHPNMQIAIIGLVSLILLFGMPLIKNKYVKAVPPALIVLVLGIVLGQLFHLTDPSVKSIKPLVDPGEFKLEYAVDFSAMSGESALTFWKWVLMFTLIGSLESLLTGKAIDLLDPYKRKAKLSQDLTAVGIGNTLSGIFGGLPMISEVARSSANINNGGKTKWANFFHGVFLLVFVVALVPVIKMVPMASLAAMLIFVGFRLASPKTFHHAYKVGKEQLAVFVITIVMTLFTDLLIGVASGIVLELIINYINGLSPSKTFSADTEVEQHGSTYVVKIRNACAFSNWISFHKVLSKIPSGHHLIVDVSEATLLDHTFMENIHHFEDEYLADEGAKFELRGVHDMKQISDDHTSARIRKQAARIV